MHRPSPLHSASGLSRGNSLMVRRQAHETFVVMDGVATKHIHVLPACLTTSLPNEVKVWIGELEAKSPISTLPISDRAEPVPHPQALSLPRGIRVNPEGYMLLRIVNTTISMDEKNYQLSIKSGEESILTCQAGKDGSILEYCLIGLRDVGSVYDSNIEICVQSNNNSLPLISPSPSSKPKSLLGGKAGELFRLTRTNSKLGRPNAPVPSEHEIKVGIPLAMIFSGCKPGDNLDECKIEKTLAIGHTGSITLQVALFPGSFFKEGRDGAMMGANANESVKYEQNLTIKRGDHYWQRTFACLSEKSLHFYDFQRRRKPKINSPNAFNNGQSLDKISLGNVTNVECRKQDASSNMMIENLIKLTFDDRTELVAYADSEMEALQWADSIHRSIWHQPYMPIA